MSEDLKNAMEENMRKANEAIQKQLEEMQGQMMNLQETMGAGGITPEMIGEMQQEAMESQQQMMEIGADMANMDISELLGNDEKAKKEFIASHPQPSKLSKYLAVGSFLIVMNDELAETLELMDDVNDYIENTESSWDIDGRESLLAMLDSLSNGRAYHSYNELYLNLKSNNFEDASDEDIEDYQTTLESLNEIGISADDINKCSSILAWDIERMGYLSRVGAHIGYITKDEAWEFLKKAAILAKDNFSNWKEYAVSIVMGRAMHMGYHPNYFYAMEELFVEEPDFLNQRPLSDI